VLWLALVIEGKAPRTLQSFVGSYLRYFVHVTAYVHLAAGPYPPFGGGKSYPVDLDVDPSPRQRRRGVLARIVLVLPALVLSVFLGGGVGTYDYSWFSWVVLSASVSVTAAILAWFSSLLLGRTPRGLRDLGAYCIGYTVQVLGYFLLVTDRYPTTNPALILPEAELPLHPVRLELRDRRERSRLIVLFRILLVSPHLIWLLGWGALALLAVVVAWPVALVIGRVPSPLHRFMAAWVRYSTHVWAFLFVIGGPFPGFVGATGSYPVDIAIEPPQRQRRLVTVFRLVLVYPTIVLGVPLMLVVWMIGIFGWWAALISGRMPEGLRNLGAVSLRYSAQINAYVFLLTDRYPFFSPAMQDRPRHVQLELALEEPVPGRARS